MRFAGRAAQFTVIIGLSLRVLISWMAWATIPLPIPVSPRIRTVASVGRNLLSPEENILEGIAASYDLAETQLRLYLLAEINVLFLQLGLQLFDLLQLLPQRFSIPLSSVMS